MEENGSFVQFEELTVEGLCNHLCVIFERPVTDTSCISTLISDDTRNIDKIQKRIFNYFGVHVPIENIVKSESVFDLYKNMKAIIDSPQYLMSEKDIRKSQLEQIANDKSITALIGNLKKAEDSLQNQLVLINKIQAPTDKIGHNFNAEWLNKLADAIDIKVSRKELIEVVVEQDIIYKGAFSNLGKAVTATNSWIDAICNALLWIVQIENDLYDISEETSTETFKFSNILSSNNNNVDYKHHQNRNNCGSEKCLRSPGGFVRWQTVSIVVHIYNRVFKYSIPQNITNDSRKNNYQHRCAHIITR